MVAVVVAYCGPIGFVGLMAPHICRLIIGHDHKYLTLASAIFGGAFLTMCDTFARTLISPAQIRLAWLLQCSAAVFRLAAGSQ
jgi:iron complex transport system permease protein